MMIHRIDIKTDEVSRLLGVNDNTARKYLRELRVIYNKEEKKPILITEFCKEHALPYRTVFCLVNKLKPAEFDKLVQEGYIELPDSPSPAKE
ncbi:MAG: hypothetical protein WCY89_10250 [Flavobacteriaceae bacterium]